MIGLNRADLEQRIKSGLTGANTKDLERLAHALSKNVAKAIEENNKKLERDIEFMTRPPNTRRF